MTTETTKSENPLRLGGEPGPRPSCLAEVRRRQVRGRSGIFQRGRVHGFPTREPFLVHFWSIFHAFFGKPLDYQPLPQQTGPPHQACQHLLGLSSINSRAIKRLREPFLVHSWSIFHGFFGTPLDYQPLPQQTGPSHQARQHLLGLSSINSRSEESNLSALWHPHFRSSVTAPGHPNPHIRNTHGG